MAAAARPPAITAALPAFRDAGVRCSRPEEDGYGGDTTGALLPPQVSTASLHDFLFSRARVALQSRALGKRFSRWVLYSL